jgi:SGT1 protein
MTIETLSNAEALLLDVYLIPKKKNSRGNSTQDVPTIENHLIALANLAVDINEYIQQCSREPVNADHSSVSSINRHDGRYPWMSGGDGPVFGIHCSNSCSTSMDSVCDQSNSSSTARMIPHLRAMCCYGICVHDEWCFVGLVLRFLQNISGQKYSSYTIAIQCCDMDDGQILFIEAAHHIPSWVDDIGPTYCHHRCWVVATTDDNQWKVTFQLIRPKTDHDMIAPTPLLLGDALDLLSGNDFAVHSALESAPSSMEDAISDRISKSTMDGSHCQRTAVVLPRSVAHFFHHRPDLIAVACRVFVENIHCPIQHAVERPEDYVLGQSDDWVWTTLSLSRTSYAMIRTITSKPDWIHEDVIAPQFLASNLEIKRLQRQCSVQATPHLRYGLQLGVRLMAGLHYCLHSPADPKSSRTAVTSFHDSLTVKERRLLLHWSQIAKTCHTNDGELSCQDQRIDWIAESWNDGPNKPQHNLNSMLKCPVFEPEVVTCLTPLSQPGIELSQQIRLALLNRNVRSALPLSTHPPGPFDVDDDRWMWTLSTSKDQLLSEDNSTRDIDVLQPKSNTTNSSTASPMAPLFDEVLNSVQTFMTGSSAVEGVDTSKRSAAVHASIPIDSTVFMNILNASLQSKSAEELSDYLNPSRQSIRVNDPFFSKEDYTMMEQSESDIDDDDCDIENDSRDLTDLMNAMDEELRTSAACRELDDLGLTSKYGDSDDIAQKTHILSNLLKSLDATAGGAGPIRNIVQEMGSDIPSLSKDSEDI